MNHIKLKKGQNIVFMKVGPHIKESLQEIIDRKRLEIYETGCTFWGYGGPTCHPGRRVQPAAIESARNGKPVYLCMSAIQAVDRVEKPEEEPEENNFFSIDSDKKDCCRMPKTIRVPESRYALVIKNLVDAEFCLPLNKSVVFGDSQRRLGDKYIQGNIDKACLTLIDDVDTFSRFGCPDSGEKIILVAELCWPYAVFLKK